MGERRAAISKGRCKEPKTAQIGGAKNKTKQQKVTKQMARTQEL